MLSEPEVLTLVRELEKDSRPERARLARLTRYSRGKQKLPWLPDSAETEYREIAKKSASNWLELVVSATAQGLQVDGFGSVAADSSLWVQGWQANDMDARQHALYRATLIHGYSYLIEARQGDGVWIRPEAASNLHAIYASPDDEWPIHAVRRCKPGVIEFYDAEARYVITGKLDKSPVVAVEPHGMGVCPIIKVMAQFDLLGDPMGEIEPVIPIQDRIVDATFNLQMVAKYGAFPQRWIAGMDPGQPLRDEDGDPLLDEDGNPVFPKIKAYVDSILTAADPDTKFGQFSAADLGQFVNALEAHIRHLAAITQTPPHYLLGSMVNLSAEALAAAESGLQRKIRERREVIGEGIEQALRLAAAALGEDEIAADPSAQVHWQDVESRSLAQTSDALLKLSQLGVPRRKLFGMIPGWTQTDADEAASMLDEDGGIDALFRQFAAVEDQTSPAAQ